MLTPNGLIEEGRVTESHESYGHLFRVRTFGDPVLKQESREVTEFGPELKALVQKMLRMMEAEEGVGLAAPQIGIQAKILVWQDPEGESVVVEVEGLKARILQHEIDHLEGRLILDRTSADERHRVLRDMRERSLRA